MFNCFSASRSIVVRQYAAMQFLYDICANFLIARKKFQMVAV